MKKKTITESDKRYKENKIGQCDRKKRVGGISSASTGGKTSVSSDISVEI